MASHPPSRCCTLGAIHTGTPKGESIKLAGKWDAYLASPLAAGEHKSSAILFLPDVLGIWQNSQLMADEFASRGYKTLVLDTFNGDALPLNRPARLDMPKWTKQGSDGQNPHTPEAVDPIVEAAVNFLKKDCGVTWLGAVGYCFGGKYVVRHYKTGIDVGYIAHPTNVTETELSSIQGPLSIAAAEKDQLFPTDKRHRSEQILSERGLPYQINLYSGVGHGFAVRGDLNKRHELFAKEQAILQAVAWFDEYLLPQGN